MKKLGFMVMAVLCAVAFTACSNKGPVETKEVSYELTFSNDTGKDISQLCLRPAVDNYRWTENLLQEELWKDGYEVPIELTGSVPVTEDGWEVKVTFVGDKEDEKQEHVWKDVQIANNAKISFTMKEAVALSDDEAEKSDDTKEETAIYNTEDKAEDIDKEEASAEKE